MIPLADKIDELVKDMELSASQIRRLMPNLPHCEKVGRDFFIDESKMYEIKKAIQGRQKRGEYERV